MRRHPYDCSIECTDCMWDDLEADGIDELVCDGCGDDVERETAHLHRRCHLI